MTEDDWPGKKVRSSILMDNPNRQKLMDSVKYFRKASAMMIKMIIRHSTKMELSHSL